MSDWRDVMEEGMRLEIVEAIDHWRGQAYLSLDDYSDEPALTVAMRIPELDAVDTPSATLADLLRDFIRVTASGFWGGAGTDEELLAATEPHYHITEQRKLKLAQDLLRLVLAYEAER